MLIGVLSDTHGLLRPELLPALAGVDHILHAGDVGDPAILTELSRIAPVTAIRGNIDTHGPNSLLPTTEAIELAGCLIYMLHSLDDLDLNPGSAGPRRFNLPITYALLRVHNSQPQAEILHLLP